MFFIFSKRMIVFFLQKTRSASLPASVSLWGELLDLIRNLQKTNYCDSLTPDELLPSIYKGFEQYIASVGGGIAAAIETEDDVATNEEFQGKKGSQQDAMEFLTFLLDALHEQIVAADKTLSMDERRLLKSSASQPTSTNVKSEDDGWSAVTRTKTVVDERSKDSGNKELAASPISQLFHGLLR